MPAPKKSLCLSRKSRETIEYVTEHGTEITVEIESIRGDKVRIRSIADESVRIRRGELSVFPQNHKAEAA